MKFYRKLLCKFVININSFFGSTYLFLMDPKSASLPFLAHKSLPACWLIIPFHLLRIFYARVGLTLFIFANFFFRQFHFNPYASVISTPNAGRHMQIHQLHGNSIARKKIYTNTHALGNSYIRKNADSNGNNVFPVWSFCFVVSAFILCGGLKDNWKQPVIIKSKAKPHAERQH